MSIPDAAISFLLENLTQAIRHDFTLISEAKASAMDLKQQLENLKGVMDDFSRYNYKHDSKLVSSVVKEMKAIVLDAEDAVDTLLLRAAVHRARGRMEKFLHEITDYPKQLLDVAREMKRISDRVKEIKQDGVKDGLEFLKCQVNDPSSLESSSTEVPVVEEEHVVGFDEAAQVVQELLTKGSEELEVISIVGMLGLGKTTLAKMVFKDTFVDYEFIIQAFVYVTKEYKKSEVLLKILESIGPISDDVRRMGEDALEKQLYKQLEGKQYLVVLDDVWEKADWDRFKRAFPKNEKRCRVLITTHHDYVATHAANTKTEPHKLEFLSQEKSRELLRWRVFGEDKCPSELQDLEIRIVQKCGGLPLALVVIAGIIVNYKNTVEWWTDVANSVEGYITRSEAETTKLIELMYKHLPNELKLCFLYLGVFREDFEIPVWKLLRLWTAEGLIRHEHRLNIEDVAEQYLQELVHRNLVMVVKRRSNGKIKTCRMHDTLREFCKNEAAEENLFQEIKRDNLGYFLSGDPTLDLCRRLCINNIKVLDFISGNKPSGRRVRSFLTFVKEETQVEVQFVSCIPTTFKLLRVLETESLIFTRFPADMSNLFLLKYIAISSNFRILPKALSALWNLQTLIINTTSPTLDIKADIWKMPQFRHLHTNTSTTVPSPPKGSNQTSVQKVQTLSTISPQSCTREIFERTPEVKKLGIRGAITNKSDFFSYLCMLTSAKNLKLLNDDLTTKLYDLPSVNMFPKYLTKFTLLNTFLNWKLMSTLGKMEYLEVLKLKDNAFEGVRWETEKGGFKCLQHLYIGRTDLAVWQVSGDHFPKFASLKLIGCKQLEAFPRGLADIPSLQSVFLHSTNSQVASTARKLRILKLELEKLGKITNSFKLSVFPPDQ